MNIPTTELFGLSFVHGTREEVLQELAAYIKDETKTHLLSVFTPNPEQIIQAQDDRKFFEVLKKGDVLLPDGNGIKWASQIIKRHPLDRVVERIGGREVARELLDLFPWGRALIIGGRGYEPWFTQEGRAWPRLDWTPAYANAVTPSVQEEAALFARIEKTKPVMVFVALGAPTQENWILEHHEKLERAGVKIAMVVGGSFDVLFGKLAAPPAWAVNLGLEWLYRLIQEPWRWKRQLRLVRFIALTIQYRLKKDTE